MEKRDLWIGTYYFHPSENALNNTENGIVWTSTTLKPKYFDIRLQFQFDRKERECELTCIRTPVGQPVTTHKLEFHCSVNKFNQDPDILVLMPRDQKVSLTYDLRSVFIMPEDRKKDFELKILVKMIEYKCDPNETQCREEHVVSRRLQQEELFDKMKEQFIEEATLHDLRYILGIADFKELFTGRQTIEFAKLKSLYITRTALFARKIADHMKGKGSRMHVTSTDLGIILNYICNGELKQISDNDIFRLYLDAHRMGLEYLVDHAREAIVDRISNYTFIIEALKVTDHTGDDEMFRIVADVVLQCNNEKLEFVEREASCLHFYKPCRSTMYFATMQGRFMLRSLKRYKRKTEPVSVSETEETSESST